jgi:ABC-type bacteriocin/lantibiotic exporter with double-glycine peptidase domain
MLLFDYTKIRSTHLKKISIFLPIIALLALPCCVPRFYSYPPNVSLAVHFIQQKSDVLCGLASVDMIADFYGMTLNSQYRVRLIKEAGSTDGIKAESLKEILEASGFDVAVFPGTLDDKPAGIFHHLDAGRPLIALISDKKGTQGHYIVLSGYNSGRDTIFVIDPAYGREKISAAYFLSVWQNEDNLILLAIPSK